MSSHIWDLVVKATGSVLIHIAVDICTDKSLQIATIIMMEINESQKQTTIRKLNLVSASKERHSEEMAFYLRPEEIEGISFAEIQRRAFLTE